MTPPSLFALFLCFLKIGCLSFGGFMSLVSMIESQVVERRKWLSHEEMLDGIALASLLPGPMAVNTVAYVGSRLRGGPGALVSAVAVLLPTTLFMLVLTALYFRFGTLPQVERVFAGILPAVAAIILSVCLNMAKKNLKTTAGWGACALGVAVLILMPRSLRLYGTFGLVALYGAAGVFIARARPDAPGRDRPPHAREGAPGDRARPAAPARSWPHRLGFLFLGGVLLLGIIPLPVAPGGLLSLTSVFSSMSLTLFGGGYVFIPMIQEVVVERFGWLTEREFIDGIALGQVTPGPILISAAFIGQKVAGIPGALLSTAAIFTPPALLTVLLAGMLDRIRNAPRIQAAMKGIRIAVIGLIFSAFINIFRMAWPDGGGGIVPYVMVPALFLLSFTALVRYKVDIVWIIPAAGLIGYLFG